MCLKLLPIECNFGKHILGLIGCNTQYFSVFFARTNRHFIIKNILYNNIFYNVLQKIRNILKCKLITTLYSQSMKTCAQFLIWETQYSCILQKIKLETEGAHYVEPHISRGRNSLPRYMRNDNDKCFKKVSKPN